MLVQCPKCKTTYKVSDEVVKGAAPAFRCSRCKHTFELGTATSPAPDAEVPSEPGWPTESEANSELSFTFGGAGEDKRSPDEDPRRLSEAEDFTLPPESGPEAPPSDAPWSLNRAEETKERPFTMTAPAPTEKENAGSPPEPDSPGQSALPSEGTADNIVPIHSFRDQAASTVPYLTLFGLLVIFFFLATTYLEAHPKFSETVVRSVPVIGPAVVRNGYLKNGVALKSLRAAYQSIQGNREVLVVSGEAVNQNPVVVREVRVAGQLYNQQGNTVEQQVIWVGNALSLKIIRGMSAQDIVDLQRLKPLKSFELPPGDSTSFAIVFLKPSKEIKEFSCEVLSAEGKS